MTLRIGDFNRAAWEANWKGENRESGLGCGTLNRQVDFRGVNALGKSQALTQFFKPVPL